MELQSLANMERVFNQTALIPVVGQVSAILRIALGTYQIFLSYIGNEQAVKESFTLHGFANIARGILELSYIPNLIFAFIYDYIKAKRIRYKGEQNEVPSIFKIIFPSKSEIIGYTQGGAEGSTSNFKLLRHHPKGSVPGIYSQGGA